MYVSIARVPSTPALILFSPPIANVLTWCCHTHTTHSQVEEVDWKKRDIYIYSNSMRVSFAQGWECRLLKAGEDHLCSPGTDWLLNLVARATRLLFIFYQAKCQTKVPGTENTAAQKTVVDKIATVQGNTTNINLSRRSVAPQSNQQSSVTVLGKTCFLESGNSSLYTQQVA